MTDSPTQEQIEHIVKLGSWRDEGHRLAVGLDGKVSIHQADIGDNHVAIEEREGAARRQGPTGRQRAAHRSGAAAASQSARQDGSTDVRVRYSASMAEVREYYPDLRVIDVEDGIWVVTQIFPIGRDGPFFSVCLFLSDDKSLDAVAYAFRGDGSEGQIVGLRHTNFPDASICAFCADDGVWAPGSSPLVLLNLYAEWLLCQMFLAIEEYWPGPQWGPTSIYRLLEFDPREWCYCRARANYGDCHAKRDAMEVQTLKRLRRYQPLGDRKVPANLRQFAMSEWQAAPAGKDLNLHKFLPANQARASMLLNTDRPRIVVPPTARPSGISLRAHYLAGGR